MVRHSSSCLLRFRNGKAATDVLTAAGRLWPLAGVTRTAQFRSRRLTIQLWLWRSQSTNEVSAGKPLPVDLPVMSASFYWLGLSALST